MTEWQTNYNRRVNAERLARQAPDVKKLATEILEELKSIEQSVYWAIDPDDKSGLWENSLIEHAHALVDLGHEYRAALKANPPPKEDEETDENEITSACKPLDKPLYNTRARSLAGSSAKGHNAMSNLATIDELASAKDAALRVIARALIKSQAEHIEDFVQVMGEELSKHADDYAQRTGDYDRAATLNIVADHLMKLDDAIENYDGAPLE